MLTRAVSPELGDIDRAVAWTDGVLAEAGTPIATRADIQVCIEEALANLILHAPDPPAQKHIRVAAGIVDRAPLVMIHDRCRPFDPVAAPLPPLPSVTDARLGGSGLRLMRSLAANLRYESGEGGNTLVMSFPPWAAPPAAPQR